MDKEFHDIVTNGLMDVNKKGNDLNRGRTTYDPKAIEALSDRLKLFFTKDKFEDYKSKTKMFLPF